MTTNLRKCISIILSCIIFTPISANAADGAVEYVQSDNFTEFVNSTSNKVSDIGNDIISGFAEAIEYSEEDNSSLELTTDSNELQQNDANVASVQTQSTTSYTNDASFYNSYFIPQAYNSLFNTSGYNADLKVNVNSATGNLTVTETDLVLKGRNGLDLSLTRMYSLSNAVDRQVDVNIEQMSYAQSSWNSFVVCDVTLTNDYNTVIDSYKAMVIPPQETGDNPRLIKCNTVQSVMKYYDGYSASQYINAINNGEFNGYVKDVEDDIYLPIEGVDYISYLYSGDLKITCSNPTTNSWYAYYYQPTEVQINQYTLNECYSSLGLGWEFDFPKIETDISVFDDVEIESSYLHFGTRGAWYIDNTGNIPQLPNDLIYEEYTNSPQIDTRIYTATITDNEGKVYYFNNAGALICIQDRFGNQIRFYYTNRTVNSRQYPQLSYIIDSLGRQINFSYPSDDYMTVSYNGRNINYSKTLSNGSYVLSHVSNDKYSNYYVYDYDEYKVSGTSKTIDEDDHTVGYALLNKMYTPTGACTEFEYNNVYTKNLGRYGAMQFPKVDCIVENKHTLSTGNIIEYDYNYGSWDGTIYQACGNSMEYDGYPYYNAESEILSSSNPNYYLQPTFNYRTLVKTYDNQAHLIAEVDTYGYRQDYSFDANTQTPELLLVSKGVTAFSLTDGVPTKEDRREMMFFEYNEDGFMTKNSEIIHSTTSSAGGNAIYEMATYDNKNRLIGYSPKRTGPAVGYTYDDQYSVITEKRYSRTTDIAIKEQYTLSEDKKKITGVQVYENDVLVRKRDYLEYDSYGNLTKEKLVSDVFTDGIIINYAYDRGAYLSRVWIDNIATDSGTVTIDKNYTYDWFGNVISEQDGEGNIYEYTYDSINRLTSVKNPDNSYRYYEYNVATYINSVDITDELTNEFTYVYDPLGNLITDDIGNHTAYDSNGNIILSSIEGQDGEIVYQYDGFGRLISKSIRNNELQNIYSENYTYDDNFGNGVMTRITKTVIGETGAPTQKTTTDIRFYNDYEETKRWSGNTVYSTQRVDYDYIGNVISITDANENVTKYEYNYDNNVVKTTDADNNTAINEYDLLGRLKKSYDFEGYATSYEYDKLGRLVKTTQGIGDMTSVTQYSYDKNNNVIKTSQSNSNPTVTSVDDYTYSVERTEYNSRNLPVKKYVENENSYVQYYYDAVGNMLRMYTGLTEPITINGLDNVAETAMDYAVTKYTYDKYKRVTSMTDPMNKTEIYSWDNRNLMTSKTDRNNVTTSFTYDEMNNLLNKTAGNESVTYTYYSTGALKSSSYGSISESYTYDVFGRVLSVAEGNTVKNYSYDLADNKTSFTLLSDNQQVMKELYEYDDRNLLTGLYKNDEEYPLENYGYDKNGNMFAKLYNIDEDNSILTEYTYANGKYLINKTDTLYTDTDETVISEYEYSYYNNGNIYQAKDVLENDIRTYSYDNIGRLTVENYNNGNRHEYQYDTYGNRSKLTATGTESYVTDYTYNKSNHLLEEEKSSGNMTYITQYTYDNNGNTISKSFISDDLEEDEESVNELTQYEYDKFNHLTKVAKGDKISMYSYGADDLRRSITMQTGTEPPITTNHVWNGMNMVAEISNNEIVNKHYYNHDGIAESQIGGSIRSYIKNGHGDVVNLTVGIGSVSTYTYDAFGNQKYLIELDTNPFRYCGEYMDLHTGLIYLRNRYYDPSIGRFITEDPARDGLNWYMYCSNNPVNRVDPSGLKDYIYTSQNNYYTENDWGFWEFLNTDRYYAEIDGSRYQANSKETVKLYDWNSFDTDFLNGTLDSLVSTANTKPTDAKRILSQSVNGDLDFKLQMNEKTLYLANGILYNKNEAGNFVWAYFLESKNVSGYISGALAQGGTILSPLINMKGMPRLDEEWDRQARWSGVKYYYDRNDKWWVYYALYGDRPKY